MRLFGKDGLLGMSDQQRAEEHRDNFMAVLALQNAAFVAHALAAGFTEAQAEFMQRYLAMANHQHLYYANMHDGLTRPITSEVR